MAFTKHKPLLLVGAFILLLILLVAVISSFWPRYEDEFLEIGLLGKDKTADNYYPNGNATLVAGAELNWYIYVHNHMQTEQNVSIRVKLLNSTTALPDDRNYKPSPVDPIAEFPLSLHINSTELVPFLWRILETENQNNSITIKRLIINETIVEANISTYSDSFYQIVFELWVYNPASNEYFFEWKNGDKISSASAYVGFKVAVGAN